MCIRGRAMNYVLKFSFYCISLTRKDGLKASFGEKVAHVDACMQIESIETPFSVVLLYCLIIFNVSCHATDRARQQQQLQKRHKPRRSKISGQSLEQISRASDKVWKLVSTYKNALSYVMSLKSTVNFVLITFSTNTRHRSGMVKCHASGF
jgi:hypothetical protein